MFFVALIAPEWVLAWALRQAIVAWKLAGELEKARLGHFQKIPLTGIKRRASPSKSYATCDVYIGHGSQCDQVVAAKRVGKADECMYSHVKV